MTEWKNGRIVGSRMGVLVTTSGERLVVLLLFNVSRKIEIMLVETGEYLFQSE
jgi:hypothetical protein